MTFTETFTQIGIWMDQFMEMFNSQNIFLKILEIILFTWMIMWLIPRIAVTDPPR